MIRLFAALPIPEEVALALARRQTGIEHARWRPLDSLHLTLRFFGDMPENLARDLDTELAGVRGSPFALELSGAGAFDDGRETHAVWAGVVESEPLKHLAKACETAARRAGVKADGRAYRPHVTLAYLRGADPVEVGEWVQANNLLKSPPIWIDRFGLYSSHQTKAGSAYRLEAEYPL